MIAGSLNRFRRNGRIAAGESGPPKFIITTAQRAMSGLFSGLGQKPCQRRDMFRRRLRQDPMPEIEDERPVTERRADRSYGSFHRLTADQQRDRVQISLHRRVSL